MLLRYFPFSVLILLAISILLSLTNHLKGVATRPEPTIANSTLDFQKIFVINLRDRTDRRDAMSLAAEAAGLDFTFIDGVYGDDMSLKGKPEGADRFDGRVLGCWRAHANIWRHMIENDIETAMVMEDDADFDMNIREIMGLWSWQLRYNNTIRWGTNPGAIKRGWSESCPYGCDWDALYTGSCETYHNPKRPDLIQRYHDRNAPDYRLNDNQKRWPLTNNFGFNPEELNQTRFFAPTWVAWCTLGYGVTKLGAMRMLYEIGGFKPITGPVDDAMLIIMQKGLVSGYTLFPPPMARWVVGGRKDSDIVTVTTEAKGNEHGVSSRMKNSVRKKLGDLLWRDHWKELEIGESKIGRPKIEWSG